MPIGIGAFALSNGLGRSHLHRFEPARNQGRPVGRSDRQTSPGGFAPQIDNASIRVLGTTNLPVAVKTDLEDLAGWKFGFGLGAAARGGQTGDRTMEPRHFAGDDCQGPVQRRGAQSQQPLRASGFG